MLAESACDRSVMGDHSGDLTVTRQRELEAERIPAGLVTGNLSAIAWKKMDAAGLRPYFQFGAFAEMADTRADLARLVVPSQRELAPARAATAGNRATSRGFRDSRPTPPKSAGINARPAAG